MLSSADGLNGALFEAIYKQEIYYNTKIIVTEYLDENMKQSICKLNFYRCYFYKYSFRSNQYST